MTIDNERERPVRDGAAPGIPAPWDWRNVDGRNFITPAGQQGDCQSSTAFAVTSAMNARLRVKLDIAVGEPDNILVPDLSPAHLFYCHGGKCGSGMTVENALAAATQEGVCDAFNYPYTVGDQNCQARGGTQFRVTQLSTVSTLSTIGEMMASIRGIGPAIATFDLHQDFPAYKGNVYRWDGTSPLLYVQTVCVVGFDSLNSAWICKNNWGPGWGRQGFFYIAWGQCGIDDQMWQVEDFAKTYPYGTMTGNPAVCAFNGVTHAFHRDDFSQLRDVAWSGPPSPSLPQWIDPGPELALSNVSAVNYSRFNQLHVCYRDVTGNIADDVYAQPYPRQPDIWEWTSQPLTGPGAKTAAPAAVGAPQMIVFNDQTHVCYRDASGNVHDVYYDGNAWHWAQLTGTQLPGGPVPQTNGGPPAVGDPKVGLWNAQVHVCYRDADAYIWRVYSAGSSWTLEQLTGWKSYIGGTPAAGEPCIVSFAGQLHICYRDLWGYIKDAYFADGNWNYQTLADRGSAAGDPVAVDYAKFFQMHVCYRDPQGCIRDVFYDGNAKKWTAQQLTGPGSLTKGPVAASDADPVTIAYNSEMHVLYRDINSNLRDAWCDGATWRQLAY